jgi:hypothetical protein
MSGHSVLVGEDGDGVHRELMSCPEYTDSNFLNCK